MGVIILYDLKASRKMYSAFTVEQPFMKLTKMEICTTLGLSSIFQKEYTLHT
jgi:hypothetical protein